MRDLLLPISNHRALIASQSDNLQAHVAFTSKKALTPIVAKMFGKQWMYIRFACAQLETSTAEI